jgi:hypothetical protein
MDLDMRTYVGRVESAGLRRFVAEDVIPGPLLSSLIREWASPRTAVVQVTLAEDDAELIHRELASNRPDSACNLLLNRARQLVPLRPEARDCAANPVPITG